MTRSTGYLGLLWFVMLVSANNGSIGRSADGPSNAHLQKLLDDRVSLHQKILDVHKSLGSGVASRVESLRAEVALRGAESDAARTKELRVATLTKIVELEKRLLDMSMRMETGKFELIQNQIRWIDAQIAVEKEKLKAD